MAVTEIVKQAKDALGAVFNLAMQDKNGDGASVAAIHAIRNSAGTTIDPATDGSVQALTGTPVTGAVMPTGGVGISGWLSAIWEAVTAGQPAGENHIGEVGGNFAVVSASFARPSNTTAYASSYLVANSTTASSVTPMQLSVARKNGGTGRIPRVRLNKSGTSLTNAQFRVHLYNSVPTPTNGDGAAWLTDQSLNYIGAFDVTIDKAFADGAKGIGTPNNGTNAMFSTAGGSQIVYALLEARAAYTPVSGETFTLTVEAERN